MKSTSLAMLKDSKNRPLSHASPDSEGKPNLKEFI